MKVKSENEGEHKFELPKPGTQIARLIRIIDLGTQSITFNGSPKELPKIKFIFELPLQRKSFKEGEAPEPFRVTKEYTKSLFEKSELYKDLTQWMARPLTEAEKKDGYDISKLLGKACNITVTIKKGKADPTKQYASITGITQLAKEEKDTTTGEILQHAQKCPAASSELILFDMENPDTLKVFDKLSKSEKAKIMNSPEWAKLNGDAVLADASATGESLDEAETEDEF